MKTVKLSLLDRLILPGVLPQRTDYINLIFCKAIIKKVQLTKEEIKKFNVRANPDEKTGGLVWDNEASKDKKWDFSFDEPEVYIIKDNLKQLNEKKELTREHVDLYELFVTADEPKQKTGGKEKSKK